MPKEKCLDMAPNRSNSLPKQAFPARRLGVIRPRNCPKCQQTRP